MGKRALHQPILIAPDEAEPDLQDDEAEQGNAAKRSNRIVADPAPASTKIAEHRPRTADEIREARRRASNEPPQDPKQQQAEDREPRIEVEVVEMLLRRPPAEGDQRDERPVEEPRGKIPDCDPARRRGGLRGFFSHASFLLR